MAHKWFWRDFPSSQFRMPEEVEIKDSGVAYPVRQPEGAFSYILWPDDALFGSEREAVEKAILAQQQHVTEATNRLWQLKQRFAAMKE